jgi:predicted small lipoprotein YifL
MRLVTLLFIACTVFGISLAGCGKKGPLVLPTSQHATHSTLSS